ncbi:MAG: sigma-70 family RNA polymerase sigma factor [Delftia sp.]|nr:sigma-70 family RNA polymerase sigma factor [Delftia sp.]
MQDKQLSNDAACLRLRLRSDLHCTLQAVDGLPETHRAVVVLRYQSGLSYKEIAQTLEINLGTVKSRLYNAHKRLGGLLGESLAGAAVAVGGVQ